MIDIGPFPISWLHGVENYLDIKPWFPLPSNLIDKGEEWVPEIQQNATVCFPISIRIGKSVRKGIYPDL
jgi:hypothetical protein